ncbi:hypothetical protein BH11ACT4_BH11ACT4_22420 [soil metagenome]
MSIPPDSPAAMSRSVGLVFAAVLSWVPLVSIVLALFLWRDLPTMVTTQWNFDGVAATHAAPQTVFWTFAPPAAVLALITTALVATVGDGISRRNGATGLGLASWLLGSITGLWFLLVLVALEPSKAGIYLVILAGTGVLFGLLVGAAVALPRRHPRR